MQRKIILSISVLGIIFATTFIFNNTQSFYKNFTSGKRCFENKQYDQAIPYFVESIRIKPDDLKALKYLLWSYEKSGDKKNVLETLKAIALKYPTDLSTIEQLADSYYAISDYAAAEILYKQALEKKPAPDLMRRLAEVLIWQKKYEEGIPLLEKVWETDRSDHKITELLADSYAWAKNYDKAEQFYMELLDQGFDRKNVLFKLAEILRFSGRDEEAVKLYEKYSGGIK